MWVFGYGSLMWDGWEAAHACLRRVPAELEGYHRVLNKASVRNWGTKLCPGPTLNVMVRPDSSCRGFAFEFAEANGDAVIGELTKREGGFALRPLPVRLPDGATVQATTPIYTGKNIISDRSPADIASMVAVAVGTSGSCRDYLVNLAEQLRALEIADAAIEEISARLAEL